MESINDVIEKYKENGYYMDEKLAKKMFLMYKAGVKEDKKIAVPTMLIKGVPGGGKTELGEKFGEILKGENLFLQCTAGMGIENFQLEPDLEAILKQDADNVIKNGILIRAINASKTKPVVVVLDEVDKSRADVDSYLLDFIQNGRVSTGTNEYVKGENPIWLMITSNDERELSQALVNRCKQIELPRIEKGLFLECLGLPEEHYMGYIYDKDPKFSLRQAFQYMNDIQELEVDFDEEVLKQYLSIDELNIETIDDLEKVKYVQDYFDNPEFNRVYFDLETSSKELVETIMNFNLDNSNIEFIQKEGTRRGEMKLNALVKDAASLAVIINEAEKRQLDELKNQDYNYASDEENIRRSKVYYSGWVNVDDSELENVIWSENEIKNTKLGIKVLEDETTLRFVSLFANGKKENLVKVKSTENQIYKLESLQEMLHGQNVEKLVDEEEFEIR